MQTVWIGDLVVYHKHIGEVLDVSLNGLTADIGYGGEYPDDEKIPVSQMVRVRYTFTVGGRPNLQRLPYRDRFQETE